MKTVPSEISPDLSAAAVFPSVQIENTPGSWPGVTACCAEDLFCTSFEIEIAEAFRTAAYIEFHPKRINSGLAAVQIDIEGQ